jgi:hypothetical protein
MFASATTHAISTREAQELVRQESLEIGTPDCSIS